MERRPEAARGTHPCGATWPLECTSSAAGAAGTAAAGSVSTASVTTERVGALYGSGGGSKLNDLHFFDRQAQGGWNLLEGSFGRIPREV